jgi:glutamyl-tRNA synthetase
MTVRVRYAPSPTGIPHVGNIRTALFNWLFARHHGGAFILRIEDTDQTRLAPGAIEAIIESLQWLGLDYDEGPDPLDPAREIGDYGPYTQSRRLTLYREAADHLIQSGSAYRCYCSPQRLEEVRKEQQRQKQPPKYDRHCRDLSAGQREAAEAQGIRPVVRFAIPLEGETSVHDAIRGEITFQNETQDDFVALKSDGFPTYHLGHIVDDHGMAITHIMRGDEWVSSTPKHVLMYEAFGWEPPVFAHLPIILGPDKAKLSKRHGASSALEFRERGFLPEALMNFLGLLGWSLDDHTEIIDRDSFIKHFDLDRVLANPAVFNIDKLTWMNGVYIRELPVDELADRTRPFLEQRLGKQVEMAHLRKIVPLIQERIKLLAEIADIADFFFVEGDLDYDVAALLGKRFADQPAKPAGALRLVLERIESLQPWAHETLEAQIRPLAEGLEMKTGDLFGIIRVAVTGKTATPPLFETMAVLGRELTLVRLGVALTKLRTFGQ